MQIDRLQFVVAFALVHLRDVEGSKARLVALCLQAQQVLACLCNLRYDISLEFVVVFIAFHAYGIDETAVGSTKQRRF